MNVVPLIDVLLVLLVMFIITIPLQSHAVKLDVPPPGAIYPDVRPLKNEIVITDGGTILWNGTPVSRQGLARRLAVTISMPEEPELHLRPDAHAPYVTVDEVLATSKASGVTKLGFVGNEAYREAF
jgi:biopolymer transport protein ExbD